MFSRVLVLVVVQQMIITFNCPTAGDKELPSIQESYRQYLLQKILERMSTKSPQEVASLDSSEKDEDATDMTPSTFHATLINFPEDHGDDDDDDDDDDESTTTPSISAPNVCSLELEGEVWFRGECVKVLKRGDPCDEGEWVILNPVEPHEPMCSPIPCLEKEGAMVLGEDGRCHTRTELAGTCNDGEGLTIDYNGLAVCECKPFHVYWHPHKRCYKMLRRGPCDEGYIINFDDTIDNQLGCRKNPCPKEDMVLWKDGKCYERETRGPCENDDALFTMDPVTLKVSCVWGIDTKNIFNVPHHGCGGGGKRDFSGNCDNGVTWDRTWKGGTCGSGLIRNPDGNCISLGK